MWLTSVTVWLFCREGVAKSPCRCGSVSEIYNQSLECPKFVYLFLCDNRGFPLACDDLLALQAKKFAYVIGRQSHRRFLSKALRIWRTKRSGTQAGASQLCGYSGHIWSCFGRIGARMDGYEKYGNSKGCKKL